MLHHINVLLLQYTLLTVHFLSTLTVFGSCARLISFIALLNSFAANCILSIGNDLEKDTMQRVTQIFMSGIRLVPWETTPAKGSKYDIDVKRFLFCLDQVVPMLETLYTKFHLLKPLSCSDMTLSVVSINH